MKRLIKQITNCGGNRNENEENQSEDQKKINLSDSEKVNGGAVLGGSTCYDEKHCGRNNNGPHKNVKTGNEKEESYFIFWSKHMKEYKCVHCGRTVWEHED